MKGSTLDNPATPELIKIWMGLGAGLLIKIAYDWFVNNRKHITVRECDKRRVECVTMATFKQEFIGHKEMTNQKIKQVENQIHEQLETCKKTAEDIAAIKTNIAVISSWVSQEKK